MSYYRGEVRKSARDLHNKFGEKRVNNYIQFVNIFHLIILCDTSKFCTIHVLHYELKKFSYRKIYHCKEIYKGRTKAE